MKRIVKFIVVLMVSVILAMGLAVIQHGGVDETNGMWAITAGVLVLLFYILEFLFRLVRK